MYVFILSHAIIISVHVSGPYNAREKRGWALQSNIYYVTKFPILLFMDD